MKMIRKIFDELPKLKWEEGKESKVVVNLLFGENPLSIDSRIKEAIVNEINNIGLYPEPMAYPLIKKISEYIDIPEKNIVVDNGIDGVINLLTKAVIEEGDEVIITNPTFPVYESSAKIMGGKVKRIELEDDFSLNIEKLLSNITEKTKAIFIANPNNPTGNILLTNNQTEKILQNFKGLLVIDECYYGICKQTAIELTKEYDNLIILRSFSKVLNMAGLRIGYAVGSEKVIGAMKNILINSNPFVLNRLSQTAASVAIEYENYLSEKLIEIKNSFEDKLRTIKNISLLESYASFSFIDTTKTGLTSKEIIKQLEKENIFIKDCSVYGLKDGYMRISIPKKEFQNRVVNTLKKIIENFNK